ncbi:hypothetical protein ABPG74_017394 [Tetrahymena malaccensis]
MEEKIIEQSFEKIQQDPQGQILKLSKENDVIEQEVLPAKKRGNKLQTREEKQEEKNEQINYQQSHFENSNKQLENIEIKQEELKVYIKKPLLDCGSSNIKSKLYLAALHLMEIQQLLDKLNAKEKQTIIRSNKLQKKKSTEDPDEIEVKDKQNLKQSSDEQNEQQNQEGSTRYDLLMQQVMNPQKQVDKKLLEQQNEQIDQKQQFLENISKDQQYLQNMMNKDKKPTTTQSNVQQFQYQNNTQPKQIIMTKQDHASRSQKNDEQDVYLQGQKQLPQDLEIEEENKQHFNQAIYEENNYQNQEGNTKNDPIVQQFKSPQKFDQNLQADKKQEEQNKQIDQKQWFSESISKHHEHFKNLMKKKLKLTNTEFKIQQNQDQNNTQPKQIIITKQDHVSRSQKDHEQDVYLQDQKQLPQDLIIDNSRKNIYQNFFTNDPLIEEQEQLEQQHQLNLQQARIYENRQKKIQAKKKYDIQQEMIPSQKIGQKLESDKQKQNEQNQQINQKQLYFENRKESFQHQEKLIPKLEKSFHTNQSSFNTIWESSKYNLKVQVGNIYKNTLKEIQVKLSTGKTTTAAVKLSSMQMGYDMAQKDNFLSESSEKLRICFTTISNFLTLDVENFFNRIMDKKQLRAFSKPNTLSQVQRWPHFTNIKELILQIDGNLAVPFIQRDMEGKIIQAQSMEINLENRLIVKLRDEIEGRNQYSEIGIRQFIEEFWFSNKTKFDKLKVDPYVAYSQINSYITGNQMSYKSKNNMISEEKYLNLIGKSKIDLDKQQKMNIYQICQQYQKWKHEKKYFDLNDIVNYIIKNIVDGYYDSENGYFHYLFVDEVQDLNCACLYLLCLLTEQNLYIGGDTAQTISQENCFKFTDLKALFSENNREIDYQVNKVLSSDLHETQLTQNFRSHGQIIELNNAIVNLLEIFFPTSLDHLIPEISLNKGPKPILINKREHLYKFLSQDTEVNENVDYFGRLQVYIVKNQDEKEILKQTLQQEGKKGQIFTVLESKGLEFQDVIAYKLLSSSYNSTKCWNALNLLEISEEKISIKDFQLKYHCQLQEEFEGSTFSREKGSDYIKMKTISKKENTDAQIKKEYSKDFNKLINELKNIYVAFSRARSRIFIYEEEIFVGKQIKNPIIKLLEDLNIIINQELNKELLQNIMKEHTDYIEKNEPIKNNKQQFICMAEMLIERKQFLDAAYYYEIIGDELNKRICIAKNQIILTLRKIEDKKDQFEKEKKQMLQGQVEIKQLVLYQSIKNELIQAIQYLQNSQEYELIAQIYFKLGMYDEAVQNYYLFRDLLQSSANLNQDQSKIKEVDSNIKHIYFLKANILENNKNNQKAIEQNYKELESFIEKAGIQDTKVQLYLSFRLNNYEKLFNNLIKFKENNLIENQDLIHILHYYYPKILEQKLEQIMLINTNEGKKKQLQDPKTALGLVLIELIQQVIIPFKDEFVRIAKSRQNMEFLQEQLKYFNQLSNTSELKELDEEQKFINGDYLMLFYIMLIQFDYSKQQKKFNDILQQQELSHQIFVDQILLNMNQSEIIKNIFDEMKSLNWLQSGKIERQISTDYQYYYAYLGLYNELKNRSLVVSSQDHHKYLNFTFQLKSFDRYKNLKFDNLYDQVYFIQRAINNNFLFRMEKSKHIKMIPQYQKIIYFLNQSNQRISYQNYLKETLTNLVKLIDEKQINQKSPIKKFILCQDLFLGFFLCLKKLEVDDMFFFDNEFIIKFTNLIKFFFSFNYQMLEKPLYGEFNSIFQDAFCSCFGFVSPHLSGQDVFDKNYKQVWQLLGYNDYYLVYLDNPYLDESIVEKNKLISPILSPEFSKLKIIEKKTATMLSKKLFGEYCTQFLKRYSEYLTKELYQAYCYQHPEIKINLPFQILYLNKCLQQFIENIDQQICILAQNIPKKHARQHEIQSIQNLIQQIEKIDKNDQNQLKLQNLKRLCNKKLDNQLKDKQQKSIVKNEIRLLEKNEINQYKSNIIQSGLVINQFLHNRNIIEERNQIQQYLLDEASNILAHILNKIEQQNEVEIQSFENLKKQQEDLKVKYLEQYKQLHQLTQDQNQSHVIKKEESIFSQNKEKDFVEPITQLQNQQSTDQSIQQEEEEKEDEEEEVDIQNEGENILQSCDDILYAFTILNMCNQRSVLSDLFKGFEKNQLTQFTQLCYQFFESRNSFDRINIGLLSNQLLLMFRENINYFTQINILQIGLAEIYLLLNTIESSDKTIKVCIPAGFGNCFSFDQYAINKRNYFNGTFFNKQLKIFIVQIQVKTYSTDINYRLIYLYINQKNNSQPFRSGEEYSDASNQAYHDNSGNKQQLYERFIAKFYKTFLHLAEKAADSQNKDKNQQSKEYDLFEFIQSIRYSEIQYFLINNFNTQNIYCDLQIIKLEKQIEEKDSKFIEDHNKIKLEINKIRDNLNKSITDDDLDELEYINMFYKQDFVMFMSQVVYQKQPSYCISDPQILQQLQKFEQSFLKTNIQIQKVRKIFLQELSLNNFQSSEKYIYIIQKLNKIVDYEKEFYKKMNQVEQSINNSQKFEQQLEQHSIEYIKEMEKVYSDYLNYITEPSEKIEKESLDKQNFIEEQINSKS